jgi:hypothetical protein
MQESAFDQSVNAYRADAKGVGSFDAREGQFGPDGFVLS